MRANIFKASLLACLLSTTALADTSSIDSSNNDMGLLDNGYVKAGVNRITGTFGSGGATLPGLQFDSTGASGYAGITDPQNGGDYLTPGSPFDGFAVMVDGVNRYNENSTTTGQIVGTSSLTDGTNSLSWTGTWDLDSDATNNNNWSITNTYSLGTTTPYIDITTGITAGTDASNVYFGRFIDPDAQPRIDLGDKTATDNVLGYGAIPDSNIVLSESQGSKYALGMYSTDSNVDAGITSPWSRSADGYTDSPYTDTDGNSINYGTGDHAIGLTWHWTSVSTGDILTASYAYIFGPSAFDAASDAVDGGAGGGADILTGTLEDVGTAEEAASGTTTTPTVTSTSAPTTSYGTWSDWAHDTDLPVLTQSQTTHDSSTADGVQTIDRETTTVVTTPEERTRTATTTVVDTYSDGSTVTRTTGTATETETRNNAVSTVTDPGAFTGRMDAADQMLALNTHRNLGIGNGISGGRITHDMGNGYSAESTVLSVGGNVMLDNGVTAGLGYNRVNTDLTGADSTGTMESNVITAQASKHIDDKGITVTGNVNVASSDIAYNRSIGDFAAAGSTTGRDMWAYAQVEKSAGTVRPFAGFTFGNNSVEAYDETGDVQATLSHAEVDEQYKYATIGINIDTGVLTATLAKDFDDAETMRYGVGIDRNINERINFSASATRSTTGDNTSTHITAGIKISF